MNKIFPLYTFEFLDSLKKKKILYKHCFLIKIKEVLPNHRLLSSFMSHYTFWNRIMQFLKKNH